MNLDADPRRALGVSLTFLLIVFAVWLVSPFFSIDRSDYGHGREYGYRLALGVLIMIVFIGKWTFDVLAPQGLARKVSDFKAVGLIVLSLAVMGFIVFIVAQAASLFLRTAEALDQTTLPY